MFVCWCFVCRVPRLSTEQDWSFLSRRARKLSRKALDNLQQEQEAALAKELRARARREAQAKRDQKKLEQQQQEAAGAVGGEQTGEGPEAIENLQPTAPSALSQQHPDQPLLNLGVSLAAFVGTSDAAPGPSHTTVLCDRCHKARFVSPSELSESSDSDEWACHMLPRIGMCSVPDDEVVAVAGKQGAQALAVQGVHTRRQLADASVDVSLEDMHQAAAKDMHQDAAKDCLTSSSTAPTPTTTTATTKPTASAGETEGVSRVHPSLLTPIASMAVVRAAGDVVSAFVAARHGGTAPAEAQQAAADLGESGAADRVASVWIDTARSQELDEMMPGVVPDPGLCAAFEAMGVGTVAELATFDMSFLEPELRASGVDVASDTLRGYQKAAQSLIQVRPWAAAYGSAL